MMEDIKNYKGLKHFLENLKSTYGVLRSITNLKSLQIIYFYFCKG